jgi:mannan endo-1,4-beta-mannosidase
MQTISSANLPHSPLLVSPHGPTHFEAESGAVSGTRLSNAGGGFSGTGYVTGFESAGAKVTFALQATAGIYTVRIRYRSASGDKGYDLVVNGRQRSSGMFPRTGNGFVAIEAGKIELQTGLNTLSVEKGWGYYDIDSLEIAPNVLTRGGPRLPPRITADRRADARTQDLLNYLIDHYGKGTLSGQYDDADTDYIQKVSGRLPAIFGADFMDYSPSRVEHGATPAGQTERVLRRVLSQGQILTMSWHWNAPSGLLDKMLTDPKGKSIDARWYKGFYTNATAFDIERTLSDPASPDYALLLRDMDAIAAELKKIARAGVPLLWRPLHEAEGGWFWWGARGPEPFKKLWRLLFDRLTRTHDLHNLLWVFTAGRKSDWYPGDAYVDVVGIDAYPADLSDPVFSDWEALESRFDGRKLVAITEFGGIPDIPKMVRYGEHWSYFVTWSGRGKKTGAADIMRLYHDPAVLNAKAR